MKKIFFIIILLCIICFLNSEELKFNKKEISGIIFKPIYLLKININEIKGGYFTEYYLIGETSEKKVLAISADWYVTVNKKFKHEMSWSVLNNYILSTSYVISLNSDEFNDSDFYDIGNSLHSDKALNILKNDYRVDFLLKTIRNKNFNYNFNNIEPIEEKKITFREIDLTVTSKF